MRDVVAAARAESSGYVFLVSDAGVRLNLSFNEVYGVCDYQEAGDALYAYTPENLAGQVGADLHLAQACPSDGVGLLWFPSRFHMPRARAFEILSAVVLGDAPVPPGVEWLDGGDISWTSAGRG